MFCRNECENVPIEDRKKALVLLYEIAFQYGTLHQMIQAIIISLKLCASEQDKSIRNIPLGNILKRLRKLNKNVDQFTQWEAVSFLFEISNLKP